MKKRAFALIGIVLSVFFFGAQRLAADVEVPASQNPCLKYLPKDWTPVMNVDIKAWFKYLERQGPDSAEAAVVKQYKQILKG